MYHPGVQQPPSVYQVRRSSNDLRFLYRTPSGYYPATPQMSMAPQYMQPAPVPAMSYAYAPQHHYLRRHANNCCDSCCTCWYSCCPRDCCQCCCDCCCY
ncbi:unnamed protein product [Somion occarium]|uniref:Cysteine-rich transmembrane CYSTM domain-containing protein n=1 Tax=Somion occarium TaxID=3059160 RepID=A0ABP1CVZ0_9APHY